LLFQTIMDTVTRRRPSVLDEAEEHECDECDTIYGSLSQLANHKQIHVMERETGGLA